MAERPMRAMLVKNSGALETAQLLNSFQTDVVFTATTNVQEAIQSYSNKEVDIIVAGMIGIRWERLLPVTGEDNLILYSSTTDPDELDRAIEKNVTCIQLAGLEGMQRLIREIAKRPVRE